MNQQNQKQQQQKIMAAKSKSPSKQVTSKTEPVTSSQQVPPTPVKPKATNGSVNKEAPDNRFKTTSNIKLNDP